MMRGLLTAMFLLVLVAALAVTGSQATLQVTSNPILRICQQADPVALERARCRPVSLLASPAAMDRDFVGAIGAADAAGVGADPEWAVAARVAWEVAWRAAVAAASANFVQRAMDWAFGDIGAADAPILEYVDASIFDPVQ